MEKYPSKFPVPDIAPQWAISPSPFVNEDALMVLGLLQREPHQQGHQQGGRLSLNNLMTIRIKNFDQILQTT